MLASLATIMKEKTALVTSMVYFALTNNLKMSGPKSPPNMTANTIGNRVSVPMPMLSLSVPIKSQITEITRAAR